MRARRSAESGTDGAAAVYTATRSAISDIMFLSGARDNERFDATVQLSGKHVVGLGDVLQREAVRDQFAGLEVAVADVFEQPGPLALHMALVHSQGQALVEGVTELHRAEH